MENTDSAKRGSTLQRWSKRGFFLVLFLMYLNFLPNLYVSYQKILLLQHDQKELGVVFQKIQKKNLQLKQRLQAQEDPYYVEFLLRKKLKLKRTQEQSIPVQLEGVPLLLEDSFGKPLEK